MNDSYVEIDTSIIKNNVRSILNKYNNYDYYIGVVKGNAYGHGYDVVKFLVDSGINYLAVSTLKEAICVRKKVDFNVPILCLQPVDINELELCHKNNITVTISSYRYFKEIIKRNIKLKVHLKLDTGMNRLGVNKKKEVEDIVSNIKTSKNLLLEGIYTHLATVGIIDDKWDMQINKFKLLTQNIDLNSIPIVHIYSSNSLVIHPKLDFCNGVRLGIIMYGIIPKQINYSGLKGTLRRIKKDYIRNKNKLSDIINDYDINVKSGFKLCSKVIELKDVEKNSYIGYGLGYKANKKCKIAIVPIGYADGLTLQNSGRNVIINNYSYPIVGVVNMKMLTVKVDNKVEINDNVIVIGDNVRQICNYTNVTPHNLLTTISANIERIYK